MIIFYLFLVVVLLGSYLLFRKKSQSNILIGSVSLLLSDLVVGKTGKMLLDVLERNGWKEDNLTILIVYAVLIVIFWGIFYAILANFYFRSLDNQALIVSVISALIITLAVALPSCFLISQYYVPESEPICAMCQKISTFSATNTKKALSYVPKDMQEIYNLPDNSRITLEDKVGQKSMLNLINGERTKEGKSILTNNEQLANLARVYAQSMVSSLRFSHIDVYNNGPDERAKALNIIYTYLGENLAIAPDIETAHNSLMNSATHRSNILSGNYHKVGIASYILSSGSIVVVEEFSD